MEKLFLVYEDRKKSRRKLSAWGPFFKHSTPLKGRLSFYVNRYWLNDSAPWWHPHEDCIDDSEWCQESQNPHQAPPLSWEAVSNEAFYEDFFATQKLIEKGYLKKNVPFSSQRGHAKISATELWSYCEDQLNHSRNPVLHPYGYKYHNSYVIGASPELLYSYDAQNETLYSMALAGTRPLSRAEELLSDVKERAEHALVIEGISKTFKKISGQAPKIFETEILRSPPLAHLLTRISVELFESPNHDSLIRALHPTPALGFFPQAGVGINEWRQQNYLRNPERIFGAPFGVCLPNGDAHFIIAIRNLCFREDKYGCELELSAGCGVVADSKVEREWSELRLKREAIRRALGLPDASS